MTGELHIRGGKSEVETSPLLGGVGGDNRTNPGLYFCVDFVPTSTQPLRTMQDQITFHLLTLSFLI